MFLRADARRRRCDALALQRMTPAHRLVQTKVQTQLAAARVARGMTQQEMWEATGISRTSYLKLERKDGYSNPPLRYLANYAIVLGCELELLIEPEWRTWEPFSAEVLAPEDPRALWHSTARAAAARGEAFARQVQRQESSN